MTESPDPSTSTPSGDQAPFLVRVAERLSKERPKGESRLTIEKALWAMVVVQAAQMDVGNLTGLWLYFL